MNILRDYAMSFAGVPYKWGGSNPVEGMDCSGYVQWLLKSVGMDPPADQTAQALYDHFESKSAHGLRQAGALAFYGKSVKEIIHVAFMIDPYRIMEAGGGDHLTLTREDAARKGACVRMNLVDYRSDFLVTLRPVYGKIGVV